MGARIAAHVANAGFPVVLLDVAAATGERNGLAMRAVEALRTSKPPAFADPSAAKLITTGNFDDDIEQVRDCNWMIEAVAENLEIKRALLAKVVPHLGADAILSTNTSGLPVRTIAEQLPPDVRRRWMGTHFFNPPRFMRLVEVIATPETDSEALKAVSDFAELRLGKTVVRANDTPNFIANRIGVFAMLDTFRVMKAQGLKIEEVDLLTGSAIGWPRTGTFRLADMVGIDVIYNVAKNFAATGGDERSDVALPDFVDALVQRRWLGDKTGQGFYKKARDPEGKEVRLVIAPESLDYKPAERASFAAVDMVKSNDSAAARIRALMNGDAKDRAAAFYRALLPDLWLYTANRVGEIASTVVEIDRAMKAGFNWELGPFEMWDAAGTPEMIERMRSAGATLPPAVERLLAAKAGSWYRNAGQEFFDVESGSYRPIEQRAELLSVSHFKKSNGVVAGNPGISLIDIGDGIGCFEFHSKMNTIGRDIVTLVTDQLQPGSIGMNSFDGFVVSADATNFSAGANLMQLLIAVQDEEWDEIDVMVRSFQRMTQTIKFSARPVIVAPFGMCLGGGTEIALHAALRQAHVELYAGLVEAGVGLIPAGGGCKEMLLRAVAAANRVRPDARGDSVEVLDAMKAIFETVAMAKVSSSAFEARSMRLLDEVDGMTMNRDRLLFDAKNAALALVHSGYRAPAAATSIPAPGESVLATLKFGVYLMREGEFISDHDMKVATKLAMVLACGGVTAGVPISEEYLLNLEREAFLSLCGEPKTQERIAYTLKTGKPLRN
jgi:3-hydroxyacyl-CoA dehydrogenase